MPSGGPRTDKIDWTPERIALLSALWKDKTPSAVIADRLGYPGRRNAVISKAHRLDLNRTDKRQYRNPGRRPKVPTPVAQPAEDDEPAPTAARVVRMPVIGFQNRRSKWELEEATSAKRR